LSPKTDMGISPPRLQDTKNGEVRDEREERFKGSDPDSRSPNDEPQRRGEETERANRQKRQAKTNDTVRVRPHYPHSRFSIAPASRVLHGWSCPAPTAAGRIVSPEINCRRERRKEGSDILPPDGLQATPSDAVSDRFCQSSFELQSEAFQPIGLIMPTEGDKGGLRHCTIKSECPKALTIQ